MVTARTGERSAVTAPKSRQGESEHRGLMERHVDVSTAAWLARPHCEATLSHANTATMMMLPPGSPLEMLMCPCLDYIRRGRYEREDDEEQGDRTVTLRTLS